MPDTGLADGHLEAAVALLAVENPSQSAIRRALSTCYFAAFHALARTCANALVGSDPEERPTKAWVEVYRGLNHGHGKTSCKDAASIKFPEGILKFADSFFQLQELRHKADYDPIARFDKFAALVLVEDTKLSIESLRSSSPVDKRAFAAWVLISSQGAKSARSRKNASKLE